MGEIIKIGFLDEFGIDSYWKLRPFVLHDVIPAKVKYHPKWKSRSYLINRKDLIKFYKDPNKYFGKLYFNRKNKIKKVCPPKGLNMFSTVE
jgi:hypothetical protein